MREENEMTRLHILQRETNEACAERIIVENKLRKLQNEVSSQGQQLRIAFSKIDSLKAQVIFLPIFACSFYPYHFDIMVRIINNLMKKTAAKNAIAVFHVFLELYRIKDRSENFLNCDSRFCFILFLTAKTLYKHCYAVKFFSLNFCIVEGYQL